MDYKQEQIIIERFKKLVNTYAWHVREAEKIRTKIITKAIPYLKEKNIYHRDIEKSLNKIKKYNKLLKEMIVNQDKINLILKEFNGEIEKISPI